MDLNISSLIECNNELKPLLVKNSIIVIDDLQLAQWLAKTFIRSSKVSWICLREMGLYELTAQLIRIALDIENLKYEDLWTTDKKV